ncbi:MAG: hypothetical protein NTW13_00895 [Candidatus Omnitrophica bacterium]|nr:hypothetical protein [Candidatus Omnitrophota bacterium]
MPRVNSGGNAGRLGTRSGNVFWTDWSGNPLKLSFYIDQMFIKNFIISHPLATNKYLIHITLEGPENAVFYRGTAKLTNGFVEVSLPDYFEAFTREKGRSVLITPKFNSLDEPVSLCAASSVKNRKFIIRGIDKNNPSQEFYWEVKAVRKDVSPLLVEPDKESIEVHGEGPYKYFSIKN